jgi:hypothetical protein
MADVIFVPRTTYIIIFYIGWSCGGGIVMVLIARGKQFLQQFVPLSANQVSHTRAVHSASGLIVTLFASQAEVCRPIFS